jgi:hypothetical protein
LNTSVVLTDGQLVVGATAATPTAKTLSGDATLASTGAITIAANAVTYAKIAVAAQGLSNVRLSKNSAYAVLNADKGLTLALSGSAFYAVTLGAASGYDSNFMIFMTNEDTRAKTISPNGLTSFNIYPGQSVLVFAQNNVWKTFPEMPQRWRFTGDQTFQVNHTSGAGDGLATGSGAFSTIQVAINFILENVDVAGHNVSIQVANETFAEAATVYDKPLGADQIFITGNPGTPSSCLWQTSSCAIAARDYGTCTLNGFKFVATTTGCQAINASQFGTIDFSNIIFGSFSSGQHIAVGALGSINSTGNYTISDTFNTHVQVIGFGNFSQAGITTITFTQNLSVNYFYQVVCGFVNMGSSVTFNQSAGTLTGQKYIVSLNGVISASGNTLPGTVAGGTSTGGQYA